MILSIHMTKEEYIKFIDNYFTKNGKEIMGICKKCCLNKNFDAGDIFTELYIYMLENQKTITSIVEIEGKDRPLMRWIATWCYNQLNWGANNKDSNFKAKYQITEKPSAESLLNEKYDRKEDIEERKTHFKKLDKINDVVDNLQEIDKKLFHIYFSSEKKMNKVKLAEYLGISTYIAKKLVNELVEKLKDGYNQ